MTKEQIEQAQYLLTRLIEGRATATEAELLFQIMDDNRHSPAWTEMVEELMLAEQEVDQFDREEWQPVIRGILHPNESNRPVRGVLKKMNFVRWMAAASLILMVGLAAYLYVNTNDDETLAEQPQEIRFKNDIAPATDGVVLTLADGRQIILDSAGNGVIANERNAAVIKNNRSLAYADQGVTEVVFNTVATQKGKTYQLQLADGTKVWLDAMSSIKFPTSFTGMERAVEVTGQAYFEVAAASRNGKKQSFKVLSGDQVIEVLGTHFNVNTFDKTTVTTLLEGSVKVSGHGREILLQPGQQSKLENDNLYRSEQVNLEQTMAWKNGVFHFQGNSIEEIMSALSRWYPIDVVYDHQIAEHFVAKINRNVPISKLLALLEMTGQVKFIIDDNKITVTK